MNRRKFMVSTDTVALGAGLGNSAVITPAFALPANHKEGRRLCDRITAKCEDDA